MVTKVAAVAAADMAAANVATTAVATTAVTAAALSESRVCPTEQTHDAQDDGRQQESVHHGSTLHS
jgi:hypothetical protein